MRFSDEDRKVIWKNAVDLHAELLTANPFIVKISGGPERWLAKRAKQRLKSVVVTILVAVAVQILVKLVMRWIENNFSVPPEMPPDFATAEYAD